MDFIYVNGKTKAGELITTILVPVLAGVLAFLIAKNYTGTYAVGAHGSFLPPILVIPAVWVPVLIGMGIASYRMKLAAPLSASHVYYAFSLLTAFVWNALLFRFEKLNAAFIAVVVYLFFLVLTFFEFEKTDKTAGYFMLPAILWGVFLAFVNFTLCKGHGGF